MPSIDIRTQLPKNCPPLIARYTVNVPVTSLRKTASPHSPQDTQLVFGEGFNAYKVDRDWAWGQCESPIPNSSFAGYIGWVRLKDLSEYTVSPSHIVTALKAPMFRAADIKSQVTEIYSLGGLISARPEGEFLKLSNGYLHNLHARAIEKVSEIRDYVSVCETFIGLPYIWGGNSTDGMDCSGLVMMGLRTIGQDAPRDSDMQVNMGREIKAEEKLRRGDLIFWRGHVGVMRDQETLLHANAHHMSVKSEPLSEAVTRIQKTTGLITARRRIV